MDIRITIRILRRRAAPWGAAIYTPWPTSHSQFAFATADDVAILGIRDTSWGPWSHSTVQVAGAVHPPLGVADVPGADVKSGWGSNLNLGIPPCCPY